MLPFRFHNEMFICLAKIKIVEIKEALNYQGFLILKNMG